MRLGSSGNVLIIGGGLLGVSTLYELAARGVPATLLEARNELAGAASYANGGMLTPSMADPWNSPGVWRHLLASLFDPAAAMQLRPGAISGLTVWGLEFLFNSSPRRHQKSTFANYALAAYSTKATDALQNSLKLACRYSSLGTLKLFETEEAMAGPLALARRLETKGLRFERLDAVSAVEKEPQLAEAADRIAGALFFPEDRVGDAQKFTVCLAQEAKKRGGAIRTDAHVSDFVRDRDAIVGVVLDDGEVLHGDVVLAAGVDAHRIARKAGVRLPVKPAKGYSLTLDAACLGDAMPRRAVIDDAMHAAAVPIGDKLRLVGTAEFTGMDTSIRRERIENLLVLFRRMYPDLADKLEHSVKTPWAGLRPMSADGRPFIGASPRRGLWLNCGHGHLGWTKAVGSARLLVDLMTGAKPGLDPAPFSYARK